MRARARAQMGTQTTSFGRSVELSVDSYDEPAPADVSFSSDTQAHLERKAVTGSRTSVHLREPHSSDEEEPDTPFYYSEGDDAEDGPDDGLSASGRYPPMSPRIRFTADSLEGVADYDYVDAFVLNHTATRPTATAKILSVSRHRFTSRASFWMDMQRREEI
eukprot:Opistho-2@13093